MKSNISNYTQEITLPSLGYLNPEIPDGKIIQRCMMVSDQKFLAGSNLSGALTTQALLERTIESPESIDVGKLTPADSLYLLFKLRILSYGESYKIKAKCPECGKRIDLDIDLSKIPVYTLDKDYEKSLEIVLPRSGDKVFTRFLTNNDIRAIDEEVERRVKKHNVQSDGTEFVLRLASMITRVELVNPNSLGDRVLEHPIDIQNYIENLTDLDATAIKSTTDSISYGVYPIVEEKCPYCRQYIDIPVSLGAGFFRPKYDS